MELGLDPKSGVPVETHAGQARASLRKSSPMLVAPSQSFTLERWFPGCAKHTEQDPDANCLLLAGLLPGSRAPPLALLAAGLCAGPISQHPLHLTIAVPEE